MRSRSSRRHRRARRRAPCATIVFFPRTRPVCRWRDVLAGNLPLHLSHYADRRGKPGAARIGVIRQRAAERHRASRQARRRANDDPELE